MSVCEGSCLLAYSEPSATISPFFPASAFLPTPLPLRPFVDATALAVGRKPSSAAFLRRRLRRLVMAWALTPRPLSSSQSLRGHGEV